MRDGSRSEVIRPAIREGITESEALPKLARAELNLPEGLRSDSERWAKRVAWWGWLSEPARVHSPNVSMPKPARRASSTFGQLRLQPSPTGPNEKSPTRSVVRLHQWPRRWQLALRRFR